MMLYHYCSVAAFHSIIKQQKIRLSLLSLSSDSKEGQHIVDVANRMLPDSLPIKDLSLAALSSLIAELSPFGFCLSAEGDLLSQWRGYADDAQGFAVGFDRQELETICQKESEGQASIRLAQAIYHESLLTEAMTADLKSIADTNLSGKLDLWSRGLIHYALPDQEREAVELREKKLIAEHFVQLARLASHAYLIKGNFFQEENEWRLLSLGDVERQRHCKFHPSSNRLIPFAEFPWTANLSPAIKEVVVGPRNRTPDAIVQSFLRGHGCAHAKVVRSEGSYR